MSIDPHSLPTSVEWSHWLLESRVQAGEVVVDATAGNGHDTEFLARIVGPGGTVYAFDLQAAAIESTRARLEAAGVLSCCTLVHAGHETMEKNLPADVIGKVAAVMFNLGWLPGHDKSCITRTETTLQALAQALGFLRPGGLLSVIVYPGHAGGEEEAGAVQQWCAALPSNTHEVRHLCSANRRGKSPEAWMVRPRPRELLKS